MAKATATTKQTGGGGFSFEDKVAARFMVMMLAGIPPLDEQSGVIDRIDFQNSADGWQLDDLVLSLSGLHGDNYLALSVKSDQQVTGNGFPHEFVALIWEQWNCTHFDVFEKSRDHLGLVVGTLPVSVHKAWHDMVAQLIVTDPRRFLARLSTSRATNKVQRKLFDSLSSNIKASAASREETALLMKRLRLLDFDFEDVPSSDEQQIIANCRDVLVSRSLAEAARLWQKMLGIAREFGPAGGSLDLAGLICRLRMEFRLKEFPDYDSDIRQINHASDRLLEEIIDTIGGAVVLARKEEISTLSSLLDNHQGVVLLGASGSGKSVLTKKLADAARAEGPIAWFDGQLLDEPSLAIIEQKLRLRHGFGAIFGHTAAPRALLILDGVDRYSDEARRNAAQLLKASKFEDVTGPWKVVLTCQPEEWDTVIASFQRLGVKHQSLRTETVDFPKSIELQPVWKAFQSLQAIAYRGGLSNVLRNLQILNVIASNASMIQSDSSSEWVGEPHVIRWFWRDLVERGENGHSRSHLLQKLGRYEGDGINQRLSVSQLSSGEASVLGELEQMRVCRVRDERISFTHDLFGDWSRLRIMLGEVENLDVFLADRITTPRRFKAVRLFALDLLEQRGYDVTDWYNKLQGLRKSAGTYDLGTDLILESVVFAANPLPLLEAIHEILFADGGILLRRLLNRFLFVATTPNSLMMLLAEKGQEATSISAAATMDRDLDWPLWPAMLGFLAAHASEVAMLAPREGAKVANVWLRKSEPTWRWRSEAARLAVAVAKHYFATHQHGYRRDEAEVRKEILCSLVAACPEQPEETTSMLLSLCKRIKSASDTEKDSVSGGSQNRLTLSLSWRSQAAPMPPPWPDGPFERVDETIQTNLLDSGTLTPLFAKHGPLAREIILALTIKHPVPVEVEVHYGGIHQEYGTESPHQWYGHLWHRGPFLGFLFHNPNAGLDTILRLVNHATTRWGEAIERRGGGKPSLIIHLEDEPVVFLGDSEVYYWYLSSQHHAHCVSCALMALEKWLYHKLEEGSSITEWIEYIWQNTRSAALLGMLNAVGRKEPKLFAGPLKPLLGSWVVHNWEFYHFHMTNRGPDFRTGFVPGFYMSSGDWLFNTARDWYQLPHRKVSFQKVALELLFNEESLRLYFAAAQRHWEDELVAFREQFPSSDFTDLEKLVKLFKIENWRARQDGDRVLLECPESTDELKARTEALERSNNRVSFSMFPHKCRGILDKDEPLNDTEVESFWTELIRLSNYPVLEDERPPIVSMKDVVVGGIAVLTVLHSEWLDAHADRRKWCEETYVAVFSAPAASEEFDSTHSIIGYHWHSFCAEIAASDWVRKPDDANTRLFVAQLVLSFREEIIGTLMRRVYSMRHQPGVDVQRLETLVVLCSALHRMAKHASLIRHAWSRLQNWGRRAVEAFVEKRVPQQLSSWEKLERMAIRQLAKMSYRMDHKPGDVTQFDTVKLREFELIHDGVDLHLLKVAFQNLPLISEASSQYERQHLLFTHRNLLAMTLRRAAIELPDDHRFHSSDGLPNEYDRWILARIAEVVVQLPFGEEASSFWMPIFDLGPVGYDWTKAYIGAWFTSAFRASLPSEDFPLKWKSQIDYLLALPLWQKKSNRSRYSFRELFTEVMGLDWLTYKVVGYVEYRGAVASMSSSYQIWATRCLGNSDALRTFCRFLCLPAAADLLADGMNWIYVAVKKYEEGDWHRAEDEKNDLVSLVEYWWQSVGKQVSSQDAGWATALGLLKILADQQHHRALEVQVRMASSV